MRGRETVLVVIASTLLLGLSSYAKSLSDLTDQDHAAISAYLVELQAIQTSDPIVDPEAPELQSRVKMPDRTKRTWPAYPPSLRRRQLQGRNILAGVVERDGKTSHIKVVVAASDPLFDQASIAWAANLHYAGPLLLDGKPVRAYMYWLTTFEIQK